MAGRSVTRRGYEPGATHSSSITTLIEQNPIEGVCLFLALNILDAVMAPGATLPLIPVAAHAWGHVPEDVFWTIAILRLVMPMDLMSYLLGLFTDISWGKYTAATAIGVTPAAFLLAYLGKLPHAYEIIALGIGGIVVVATSSSRDGGGPAAQARPLTDPPMVRSLLERSNCPTPRQRQEEEKRIWQKQLVT